MNKRRALIFLAIAAALGGFATIWVWQSSGLSGAERALKQAAPSEYAEYKRTLKELNEARKAYISTGKAIWAAENDERQVFIDAQFAVGQKYRKAWDRYLWDRNALQTAVPSKWAIYEAELITAIKKSAPEEWAALNKAIETAIKVEAAEAKALYALPDAGIGGFVMPISDARKNVLEAFKPKVNEAAKNKIAARALLEQAAPAEYAAWAYAVYGVLDFRQIYEVDGKVWGEYWIE